MNYTYIDSNGDKWVCDTIEPDGNGGYNYVQRIGEIASYNGESVGDLWMSSTGELSIGATVIYALTTPVVTALSASVFSGLEVMPGTNTFTATDSPEMTVSYLSVTESSADNSDLYEEYLNALDGDFVKIAKLEFLNPDGTVAFSLDNNALNTRSGAFLQSGNISCNRNNGPRRQATVTLDNIDNEFEFAVNHIWFGQQIRLSEGLILPDGTEYYIPQGVFEIEDPQESLMPGQKTVTYSLVDKWANLDGTLFGNLEDVYAFPAGINILTAMASILRFDRFTMENNGSNPIDPVAPIFTNYYNNKTQTLTDGTTVSLIISPYEYKSTSTGTLADVMLGLNEMIAGDIGYNQNGRLVVNPSQDDLIDADKPVLWDFTQNGKSFWGAKYTTKKTDVFNDVVVVGATTDLNITSRARAQNTDPTSDTCISRIGLKTTRLEMPNFYSDKVCEDYANWMLKRVSTLPKEITITCSQMFHIVENELITLQRTDKPESPVERHVVTGFTRPIAQTGSMTINCVSINDYPKTGNANRNKWSIIQTNVRNGLASTLYPVGTQFTVDWNGDTYHLDVVDTGYTMWTMENGTPVSHSALALMFHEVLQGSKYYDAGESTAANWGKTGDGVKTFADLTAEIYATYPHLNGETFNWLFASDRTTAGASDSTAVTENGVAYLANSFPLGASSSSNAVKYGCSAPYVCNVMQWLNSDGEANSWYEPWHIGDESPNYANVDGFLKNLDPDLVSILIPCATASANLSTNHYTQRVFMPFQSQVSGDATWHLAAYTNPTDADRIKYDLGGTACAWHLNSRYSTNVYSHYCVTAAGVASGSGASMRGTTLGYIAPLFYIF